jgi:tetratricopeptide (TPR) repeat protein
MAKLESSISAEKLAKAQKDVAKKIEEQKAAREKFKADKADCENRLEFAKKAYYDAEEECRLANASEILKKQAKINEAQRAFDNATKKWEQAHRLVQSEAAHARYLERERKNSSFYEPPFKGDVKAQEAKVEQAQCAYGLAQRDRELARRKLGAAQNDGIEYNPDQLAKAQESVKARDEAKKKMDEVAAECAKLKEDNKDILDESVIEKMKEVPVGRKNVSSLAALRANRFKSSTVVDKSNAGALDPNKLIDLRNVNEKNFRGWSADAMKGYAAAGISLTPSRSFYMNQNYLFSDCLAKIGTDFQKFRSTPEIQQLILNEFQPYQMLSIKDLIPQIGETMGQIGMAAANAVGSNVIAIAKNAIHNNFLDRYSQDPSTLYTTNHKREYFTDDPVTQVRNMFNGGIWLNTYELPFYGKDYLKATNSRRLEDWSC